MLLGLIVIGIVFVIVLILARVSDGCNLFFRKAICSFYRMTISSDIDDLCEKNKKYLNVEKIGWFERKLEKGGYKKHKERFDNYLQFCSDHGVEISVEDKELAARCEITADLLDPRAALDKALTKANEEYRIICEAFVSSGKELYSIRKTSVEIIEKVEFLVNSIAKHPKEFNKDFQEVNENTSKFKDAEEFGVQSSETLRKTAIGGAIGVSTGIAVTAYAPTAAMWIATTFGTTSTGTAISALSGAAATNAALAWLGGGALSAGGAGMAAGKALLALAGPIGWGIAGASTVIPVLVYLIKSNKAMESEKEEVTRILRCTESLKESKATIDNLIVETKLYNSKINALLQDCTNLRMGDYTAFSERQKNKLRDIVNHTKLLSRQISIVIVQEEDNSE